MNNLKKTIFTLVLIFSTSLFIGMLFINNVNASSLDIDFRFDELNPYLNYDTIVIDNYNLRHNNIITETFNATFTFTDDINEVNPNNFTVSESGGTVLVISGYDKHSKILQLYDTSGADDVIATRTLNIPQSYGTIEWWWKSDDVAKGSQFSIYDGATPLLSLMLNDDKFQYYDGGWNDVDVALITYDNIWYHIRVDFECTSGNYQGLSQYDWHIYIDDVHYGNYDFANNQPQITNFFYNTGIADNGYHTQIDAIGNTWLNYILGNNSYPIIEIVDSNIFTSDKYEFTLKENAELYQDNDNDILGWSQYDTNGYVVMDDSITNNMGVLVWASGGTQAGIYNNSLGIHNDNISISFDLKFIEAVFTSTEIYLIIKSIDNSTIVSLLFDIDEFDTPYRCQIYYHNGATFIPLFDIYQLILPSVLHSFNLYLSDFSVDLNYSLNSIYNSSYSFDLIVDKKGMNYIELSAEYIMGTACKIHLDNIGIYQYNISHTLEHGYLSYDLASNTPWFLYAHNLFFFNSNDSVKIVGFNQSILYHNPSKTLYIRDFDSKPFFCNFIESEITIPFYFLILITNNINLNELTFSIEGVKLIEFLNDIEVNGYIPIYTFMNQNENQSYFYVINHRLYYIMNITQNDTWERIRIDFDIYDKLTDDRSLLFYSQYNGIGIPTFLSKFHIGYGITYDFKTYLTHTRIILEKNEIITDFALFIDDIRYSNNNTGFVSTGNMYDLSLSYLPQTEITLLTLALIDVMIPIILIFIPTIAIYFVYGKKSIIPMLILMCIICFISNLIPLEIFFIIILCLGCSLVIQYKKSSEV